MQQFRVILPQHVKAGDTIRIQCPDGTEADVRVPAGLKGGDAFYFDKRGFLDREIVTYQDCCLAMVVGLIIGCAIVVGFLWGVLTVTDPNQESLMMNTANANNFMTTTTTATDTIHQLDSLESTMSTTAAAIPPSLESCDHLSLSARQECLEQLQQLWQDQSGRQKLQLQLNEIPVVDQQPTSEQANQHSGDYYYRHAIKVDL